MPYTPPAHNAVDASWQGRSSYTPPSSSAGNASLATETVTAQLAASSPLGAAVLVGDAAGVAEGLIAAASPLGSAAALGSPVVRGLTAASSPLGAGRLVGFVIPSGRGAAASPLGAGRIVATVVRYELRGEVRDQGVLVNRRVRAYRRDTGALVAEADTAVGAFVLPVGFSPAEHYLVPINLDAAAADYSPPTANRVTPVLAMDPA